MLRITKFTPTGDGAYSANVSVNGTTVPFTNELGSWMTPPDSNRKRREALPFVAEALQAKVPRAERGKR